MGRVLVGRHVGTRLLRMRGRMRVRRVRRIVMRRRLLLLLLLLLLLRRVGPVGRLLGIRGLPMGRELTVATLVRKHGGDGLRQADSENIKLRPTSSSRAVRA
jgi:hypothetical protein